MFQGFQIIPWKLNKASKVFFSAANVEENKKKRTKAFEIKFKANLIIKERCLNLMFMHNKNFSF